MGNCGSCFGDGAAIESSGRHAHHREHHRRRAEGPLSDGYALNKMLFLDSLSSFNSPFSATTRDTEDSTIKRALVQSATEERIKQVKDRLLYWSGSHFHSSCTDGESRRQRCPLQEACITE